LTLAENGILLPVLRSQIRSRLRVRETEPQKPLAWQGWRLHPFPGSESRCRPSIATLREPKSTVKNALCFAGKFAGELCYSIDEGRRIGATFHLEG
jgi:hypothetical protein